MNSAVPICKPRILSFDSVVLILIVMVMLITASASGRNLYSPRSPKLTGQKLTTEPCSQGLVHDVGRMALAITNIGFIGSGLIIQPDFPYDLPPSCQYPYPSEKEHLFLGSLWIGAIVGSDTLVSVGIDGWQMTKEMWPETCPEGAIRIRSNIKDDSGAVSEQDYIAIYTDTLTNPPYVFPDPFEGRPHIPLKLEVTQKSYAWSNPEADDFVIFDFNIKNIGAEILEDVYIGYYVDGDVKLKSTSTGFEDDICGLKQDIQLSFACSFTDSVHLAWIADNDGRQESSDPCPYENASSLTSVTGILLLATPGETTNFSFNWWISNENAGLDWGPRKQGTVEYPMRDFGGFLGTPEGDRNKYYIMSHPEIDYDQLFTSVDHSSEGWLAPPPYSDNLADGTDTRYLLSFGPFDIMPGESAPFAFAYVAGENFHTDCEAFENLFDPYSPQAYADQLNFDEFVTNALQAKWLYDIPGYDTDSDGYAGKYYLCGVEPDQDTIFYEGDGVPDLKVPQISPYRKSLRLTLENDVDVRVRWNGLVPETRLDYRLGYNDFEGYSISYMIPQTTGIIKVAEYDKEDFWKLIWDFDQSVWVYTDVPFTREQTQALYSISDPMQYSAPDTALAFHWLDSLFYFMPVCANNSNLFDPLLIHKLYPYQPYPSTFNIDSLHAYYPDELTHDGFLKYFEYEYVIRDLEPSTQYVIKVAYFDFELCRSDGSELSYVDTIWTMPSTDVPDDGDGILAENFRIHQNYPNPFNPSTEIQFDLPRKENVTFTIFNLLGQTVKEFELGEKQAGSHTVIWDGTDNAGRSVATGIYLYRITAGDFTGAKKMVLLK